MAGVLILVVLTGVACVCLRLLTRLPEKGRSDLVGKVERILPQTQCAQCGYAGCRPYAEAIVSGEAEIDSCPPGGAVVIRSLAELLNRPVAARRADLPAPSQGKAVIDEQQCIGCALCLPACPVDAIVGAPQWAHAVLSDQCTGCELCIAPCPVDCISMRPAAAEDAPVEQEPPAAPLPCVHCDACDNVCPEHLPASDLYHHTRLQQWKAVADKGVAECIECDLCVSVCPSRIPLTDFYRYAKRELSRRERAEGLAARANARYQRRQTRLIRDQAHAAAARERIKAVLRQKTHRAV